MVDSAGSVDMATEPEKWKPGCWSLLARLAFAGTS